MSGAPPEVPVAERRAELVSAARAQLWDTVEGAVADPEPSVRSTAVGLLVESSPEPDSVLESAMGDPDPRVRRRLASALGRRREGDGGVRVLLALLDDDDATVAEMAAWAAGEWRSPPPRLLAALSGLARHDDALCREAAVAALGSLAAEGHEDGRQAVLAGLTDIAAVRRRAVLALAAFEGPDVDAALQEAVTDRDRQVRQGAEDLLGL